MQNTKNNQVIINGKQSLARRIITWVTVFFFLSQSVTPALASMMSDQSIENDLISNQELIRDLTNAYHQYVGSPYINASAPTGKLTSIEDMLEIVTDEHDFAVGGPITVPISTSGITIFIQTYPKFKAVGDPLVQSRFVRTQIRALLGRTLIDSSRNDLYGSEAAQLQTLFQNAINYIQSDPSKRIGDRLGFEQDGAPLAAPMIWPELRTIHGEEVLVPIVYLTQVEMSRRVQGNTVEINEGGVFGDLIVDGSTIKFGRDAFIEVVNNLINNNGYITSDGNLTIEIGGQLRNLSALIKAEGDLAIAAKNIYNGTIVHQHRARGENYGEYYFGEISEINSENGDVILRATEDIIIAGALVEAGNDIRILADGNVYVGTVNISESYRNFNKDGWRTWQGSSIQYLGSALTAQESIEIIASGQVQIDASEIVADNGHIEILAGLGITIQDQLNSTESYKAGKFGKTRKDITEYKSFAMRSLLDAGRGLILHSEYGDVTLKAVDITSTEGTSVTAANGAINVLVTKETDHYSYNSVRKGTFTTKTKNRGHTYENVIPTTIIGGFEANPLYGLNIEYEGNPDFTMDEQLDALQRMQGLEWIADVRNPDPEKYDAETYERLTNVNWTAVESKYEEWNKSNTSLSPAAIAIITIAVTVATGGAGTGLTGAISTAAGSGAIGAAAAAASVSLITAATVAAANAAVNGGDLGDIFDAIFETVTSSDALKSAAISAVTAGAIAAIDAEFFNTSTVAVDTAGNPVSSLFTQVTDPLGNLTGGFALSLSGQIYQAAIHASVSAAVDIIANGGDLGVFGDVLLNNFAKNAVSILGERLARQIGNSFKRDEINQFSRYLAHAATGCLTGALTASIDDGDEGSSCASGAGGAVIGEFVGDLYLESKKDEFEAAKAFLEKEGKYVESLGGDLSLGNPEILKQLEAQTDHYINQLSQLETNGVELARLGAALGAFIAGAEASEIYIAADSGANAAENNAFWFIPLAIIALKAIDLAITANEYKTLYDDYTAATTDEEKKAVLIAHFGGKIEDAALDILLTELAKRVTPGATTGLKIVEVLNERGLIPKSVGDRLTSYLKKKEGEAGDDTTRSNIADARSDITADDLGESLGSGGVKDVFEYGDDQAIAIIQEGGNVDDILTELDELSKLDDLDLPTANPVLIDIDGQPGILMDRFEEGSKDIVRTIGNTPTIVGESLLLNQKSIDDLLDIKEKLIDTNTSISDLQFLIASDGSIVIADPVEVILGRAPSPKNKKTINRLIEAATKNL